MSRFQARSHKLAYNFSLAVLYSNSKNHGLKTRKITPAKTR